MQNNTNTGQPRGRISGKPISAAPSEGTARQIIFSSAAKKPKEVLSILKREEDETSNLNLPAFLLLVVEKKKVLQNHANAHKDLAQCEQKALDHVALFVLPKYQNQIDLLITVRKTELVTRLAREWINAVKRHAQKINQSSETYGISVSTFSEEEIQKLYQPLFKSIIDAFSEVIDTFFIDQSNEKVLFHQALDRDAKSLTTRKEILDDTTSKTQQRSRAKTYDRSGLYRSNPLVDVECERTRQRQIESAHIAVREGKYDDDVTFRAPYSVSRHLDDVRKK